MTRTAVNLGMRLDLSVSFENLLQDQPHIPQAQKVSSGININDPLNLLNAQPQSM